MEIKNELITSALEDYTEEVEKSHLGTPEDSLHATKSHGMRKMLFKLEILDKYSNHEIVEAAIKTVEDNRKKAENKKKRLQKMEAR